MAKKKNFAQYIEDEDRFDHESENWGKYRHKDGKREDTKKQKIRNQRRRKQADRNSYFDG